MVRHGIWVLRRWNYDGMDIRLAELSADLAIVRQLWGEYWESLGLPMDFQGFGDELKGLPGVYGAEGGALLLAFDSRMSRPELSRCGVWIESPVK